MSNVRIKLKKTFVTPMWKIASRHAVHRSNLLACHMWTFHPKRKWNFAHGVCFQITTSMNCLCVTDVRIAEWDLQDMAISRLPATKVLYRFIRRAFCLGEIKMLVFCGTERLSPRMHNIIILYNSFRVIIPPSHKIQAFLFLRDRKLSGWNGIKL